MITWLSVFGLCYLFVWSLVGFYLGVKHESHVQKLESSAKKGNFQDYFGEWSAWKLHAGGHAHALLLALICIIVALIMPQMVLADTIKTILVAPCRGNGLGQCRSLVLFQAGARPRECSVFDRPFDKHHRLHKRAVRGLRKTYSECALPQRYLPSLVSSIDKDRKYF